MVEKISTALTPMNCGSWSIHTTLSSASAAKVLCWAYLDRRNTTGHNGAGIDAAHHVQDRCFDLEDPCSGSRQMVEYLARQGIPISRDRL